MPKDIGLSLVLLLHRIENKRIFSNCLIDMLGY